MALARTLILAALDRAFPRRICKRSGHDYIGFSSMGPHDDGYGGQFYALRYRIMCRQCRSTLDTIPRAEWPKDGEIKPW